MEEGEHLSDSLVRESQEEVCLNIQSEDAELAHVMHRLDDPVSGGSERLNFFFRVCRYEGEPKNGEPHKCDELAWFPLDALPENTIPYIRAALGYIRSGGTFSEL